METESEKAGLARCYKKLVRGRVFFFRRHFPRFDYWPSGLLNYGFMGYVVEVQEEKHLEFKYT